MEDTLAFHEATKRLTEFCLERGFVKVPAQGRKSILAACENPFSIMSYELRGEIWPLPQTGQMWLEHELLKNPSWPGVFCETTSYRNELAPQKDRHDLIFPMFEFEIPGGIDALRKFEMDLVRHLGFRSKPVDLGYEDACERYRVDEIEAKQETKIGEDYGSVVLLQGFPKRTHPFWNMKHAGGGIYNKIDVLLYGMETIGSAERSCDVEGMRENFGAIVDGKYAQTLYQKFGERRVREELDKFLELEMFERSGGGIGMTRLVRAMKAEGLL